MTSKHCVNVNFKGRETSRRKVSEHSHCPCFGIHTLAAAAFVCICFGDKLEDTYWREQHKPFEKNDVYCFQDGLPRDFKQTILFKKAMISQLRQPFLPWLLRDKASVSFGPNRLQRRSCRRGLGPIGSKEHNLERAVQGESLSILSCRETISKKYWKFAPTVSWAWPSISTGFTPSPLKVWAQPLARH